MDIQHLKENIISLIKDVNSVRPKREGAFVTRVLLKSPPSSEQLKIDPFLYIPKENELKSNRNKSKQDTQNTEEIDEDDELRKAEVSG